MPPLSNVVSKISENTAWPPETQNPEPLLSEKESAAIAGVSPEIIERYKDFGLIESIEYNGSPHYRESDIRTLFYTKTPLPTETKAARTEEASSDAALSSPETDEVEERETPSEEIKSDPSLQTSSTEFDAEPPPWAPSENAQQETTSKEVEIALGSPEDTPLSQSQKIHDEFAQEQDEEPFPTLETILSQEDDAEQGSGSATYQRWAQLRGDGEEDFAPEAQETPAELEQPTAQEPAQTLIDENEVTLEEGEEAEERAVTPLTPPPDEPVISNSTPQDTTLAASPAPTLLNEAATTELTTINQGLLDKIELLREERDWLRQRVEKLEARADREQMLLLSESETVKRLLDKRDAEPKRSFWSRALSWSGLISEPKKSGRDTRRVH